MLIRDIEALIPEVMKSGDKVRLETIRAIKNELMKAQIAHSKDYELSKEEEDKILIKMISNLEESIVEFKKGNRNDLVEETEAQLKVVKEFAPKIASDEEIESLAREIIPQYIKSKGEGYTLSMRDMNPIMNEIKKTYSSANGKVVSSIIRSMIG